MAVGEVEVHMKLNHPNIIKMLDFAFDEKHNCTFIVLEFAENGTLFDYIRENGMKDKVMARGIFHSVCDAVEYLHSKNIMHRDIKVYLFLFSPKIFFSTGKMSSSFAISVLLLTANLEWRCVGQLNTCLHKWFWENPTTIKLTFGA